MPEPVERPPDPRRSPLPIPRKRIFGTFAWVLVWLTVGLLWWCPIGNYFAMRRIGEDF